MITIRHTHAEGTIAEGTSRGDGSNVPLKAAHFRWSRELGAWYVPNSRDRLAKRWNIDRAKAGLEAAGFTVEIEIDETDRRDFAEAEAERYDRAENRADRMAGYADNAAARSDAAYQQVHQIGDMIPMGQPILVGHHSERRHRRDIERMHQGMRTSIAEQGKAEHFAGRAEAAGQYRERRENIPTTLRRIAKLEADERRVKRDIAGRLDYVSDGEGGHKMKLVKPEGTYLERLNVLAADLAEQLAYWREHVAKAQESGVKVWSAADFAKGDFALTRWGWVEVLRVNPKTLTHPWGCNAVHFDVVTRDNTRSATGGPGWTDTAPYDEVRGRKSADEMAAAIAAGELSGTDQRVKS